MCLSIASSESDFTKSPFQYHCRPFGKNGSNSPLIAGIGIMPIQSKSGAGKSLGGGPTRLAALPFRAVGARDHGARALVPVLLRERVRRRNGLEAHERAQVL